MIKLTKFNGDCFYINPHQIERIEERPDTVITMLSQNQYIVKEKIDEINKLIVQYRQKLQFGSQE
ncbi:MAG: flagellar protein FlbD [Spirochaetes bacterium GWD1_27_9]|nr:MAG: flagellar protein FlbD [Spirochaetes bacterium GWB1_27_13]OHD27913.1 MAG: flagellar protein FlbD [Spirochaetes bacterium GWC1_27_15]OHD39280.1 MAG: flagellar protein FlbD [Spirochaetes bacterium GWD1_27_9]